MLSIGTRGVTIVTIITLVFVTFIGSDGSVSTSFDHAVVETKIEKCLPGAPCPIHRLEIRTRIEPPTFAPTVTAPRARCEVTLACR